MVLTREGEDDEFWVVDMIGTHNKVSECVVPFTKDMMMMMVLGNPLGSIFTKMKGQLIFGASHDGRVKLSWKLSRD